MPPIAFDAMIELDTPRCRPAALGRLWQALRSGLREVAERLVTDAGEEPRVDLRRPFP